MNKKSFMTATIIAVGVIALTAGVAYSVKAQKKNQKEDISTQVKPVGKKLKIKINSEGNYNAVVYNLPTDINFWNISNNKVLYSTKMKKEELFGKYFDLKLYDIETGEVEVICELDKSKEIYNAKSNDKYILWKEEDSTKVMDIYTKEISYQGDISHGEYLDNNKAYLFSDDKIREINLEEKTETVINFNSEEGRATDLVGNDKFVAIIVDNSIIVYSKEDKSTTLKNTNDNELYTNIVASEDRLIFQGAEFKDSIEYDFVKKDFKEYEMARDFEGEIIEYRNMDNSRFGVARRKDLSELNILDILKDKKISIDVEKIEDNFLFADAYNDYVILLGNDKITDEKCIYAIKITEN